MKFEVDLQDRTWEIHLDPESEKIAIDEQNFHDYELHDLGSGSFLLRYGYRAYRLDNINVDEQSISFNLDGMPVNVPVRDEQHVLLKEMGFKSLGGASEGNLTAPMPGKILEVKVSEGDEVRQGTPLIILEAMKMENELKSPVDGSVSAVHVKPSNSVDKNAVLIEIK